MCHQNRCEKKHATFKFPLRRNATTLYRWDYCTVRVFLQREMRFRNSENSRKICDTRARGSANIFECENRDFSSEVPVYIRMLLLRAFGKRRHSAFVYTFGTYEYVSIVNQRKSRPNAIITRITRSSYRGHVPVLLRLSMISWQPSNDKEIESLEIGTLHEKPKALYTRC
jgi:hypothetical protein